MNSCTIFYWAWRIAWAPFVGIFIACISKGRTIEEFIAGVIAAPALVSMVWFGVFGAMGLNLSEAMGVEGLAQAASNPSTALFRLN